MKTIILTGGGTAGHVTPNIALIPGLTEAGFDIQYIGSKNGPEKILTKEAGLKFRGIHSGKLRRYFDLKNISDIFLIITGIFEAFFILWKLKPSVIFSKGGYVSCPVVWAGRLLKIPAVVHESDITPGLANRLTLPFAEKICCSFPETMKSLPEGKGIYTGLPVRDFFRDGNKSGGLKFCRFSGKKPVILIMCGSQGSTAINNTVRQALQLLLKKFDICHICGKGNIDPSIQTKGYAQFEYVSAELPDLFAAADLIISRAGATSVFEIMASGKASLLIPLGKEASRGDQIDNAKSSYCRGLCNVLDQSALTPDTLISAINDTYKKKEKYIKAIKSNPSADGVSNIIAVIKSVVL